MRVDLRGCMDAHVWQQHPNRAQQAEVLDDDGVHTGLPRSVDKIDRLGQLVLEHHDVCRQIDANAAQVRESADISETGEGEVLGATTGIEALDAEIHRVSPIGHGSPKRVGPARRREEFRRGWSAWLHVTAPALE